MNHRKKIFLGMAAVIIVASATFIWSNRPTRFQGRTVAEWTRDLAVYHPNDPDSEASQAIAAVGADAVPDLLKLLEKEDAWWVKKANHLLRQQNWTSYSFPTSDPNQATQGFRVLGDRASIAVERLINIFTNNPSEEIRAEAAYCLAAIGSSASNAVDALIASAFNGSPEMANASIVALTSIGARPARVIPVYTNWIGDPWVSLSFSAASGLRSLGTNALDAIPSIVHAATNGASDQLQGLFFAIYAIELIDPETADQLNKELESLRSVIMRDRSNRPESARHFLE